ncbi:MAG: molybdopterin biosynthesis protein, partial [Methanoregulaceae archaeon]
MVKRYLDVISLNAVTGLLERNLTCSPGTVKVPLEVSVGRISASPIFSRYSVPEIHLAAMDGIAVKSSQTINASDQYP